MLSTASCNILSFAKTSLQDHLQNGCYPLAIAFTAFRKSIWRDRIHKISNLHDRKKICSPKPYCALGTSKHSLINITSLTQLTTCECSNYEAWTFKCAAIAAESLPPRIPTADTAVITQASVHHPCKVQDVTIVEPLSCILHVCQFLSRLLQQSLSEDGV